MKFIALFLSDYALCMSLAWNIAAALSMSIFYIIVYSHINFNLSIPNISAASNNYIAFYTTITH
jgi:hypothetical protein